jgi:hypothetical protein
MMKKAYTCPEITKVHLDNTISLQMQSAPGNPDPRAGGSKGGSKSSDPFESPFGNKPFG